MSDVIEPPRATLAAHNTGEHDDPKANPGCVECRQLIWLHAERAADFTPQALRHRANVNPMGLAREFKQARQDRTVEIVALLRQEADHPAAPPGRSLYVSEVADLVERTYGVRG